MPTYDYQCRVCGTVTEVIHSMLDSGPTACERCGGELRRVLYPTGIIFKGSGFYRTDHRAGGSASTGTASADSSSGAASGSETSSGGDGKAPPPASEGGAPAAKSGAKTATPGKDDS